LRDDFKAEIIDFLVEGYAAGVTPLPARLTTGK